MRISELVKDLETWKIKLGDVHVFVEVGESNPGNLDVTSARLTHSEGEEIELILQSV